MSCPGMEVLTPTGVRVPRRAALQLETGDIQDRQICRISLIILHWIERWGGLGMVRLKDFRLWSSIENQKQEVTSESLTASSLPQKRFCCIIPQQCWLWGQPKGLRHTDMFVFRVGSKRFFPQHLSPIWSKLWGRGGQHWQWAGFWGGPLRWVNTHWIWCFPLLGVPCARPRFQFFPTPVHITKH